MDRLKDKVAIVTGSASGMGLATLKIFLNEGAKVVATTLNTPLPEELKADENVLNVKLDSKSEENWKEVVVKAKEKFDKIDILVNNAGISIHKPLLEEDLDGWNLNIANNLTSIWLGMKAVIPYMQQNGKGSIVNCSSLAALNGSIDNEAPAYCAAKGGVRSLSRHAAFRFAKDGIRVNTVYPGVIYTGATTRHNKELTFESFSGFLKDTCPLPPHCGQPEDLAYAYLYFASDESKYVTGAELVVDGGVLCK